MNTRQLGTFSILLTVALGTSTAWSSQTLPATSAAQSHANVPGGAKAESENNAGAADRGLPGIVDEEEIPAYLRMDPCDTEDS